MVEFTIVFNIFNLFNVKCAVSEIIYIAVSLFYSYYAQAKESPSSHVHRSSSRECHGTLSIQQSLNSWMQFYPNYSGLRVSVMSLSRLQKSRTGAPSVQTCGSLCPTVGATLYWSCFRVTMLCNMSNKLTDSPEWIWRNRTLDGHYHL